MPLTALSNSWQNTDLKEITYNFHGSSHALHSRRRVDCHVYLCHLNKILLCYTKQKRFINGSLVLQSWPFSFQSMVHGNPQGMVSRRIQASIVWEYYVMHLSRITVKTNKPNSLKSTNRLTLFSLRCPGPNKDNISTFKHKRMALS